MTLINAAVVREKGGDFLIEELILDDLRPHEVLVNVVACGVCHSDLVIRDQEYPVPLPMVLGHEGAGIIEKVGNAVTHVQPGDHVVMSFGACGVCRNCLAKKPFYCLTFYEQNFKGSRMDGSHCHHTHDGEPVGGSFFAQSAFSNFALVPETNVIKIRKDVPLELMGPLGCGIQTGAGAIINVLQPEPGSSVAIFGAGAVGLSAALAAIALDVATVIMIDINAERLAFAKTLGVSHTINSLEQDPVTAINAILSHGVDYSLECTGRPAVFRQAVEALSTPGVCGLLGAAPLGTEVTLDMSTLLFGRTIRGIVEGESVPAEFIPQLIELWHDGKFPFEKLIKLYDFTDINKAVKAAESGSVIKPVLRMIR
ncbi:NAD(P)-dependent alcohol dehydrogenase [Erwinia sp. 198]|uniref:NAD(P)-dependent alcohol dehydrogenase n=1 Tax=Erwinia sp. 198 TaxID=2022746 RepID=UPI000F66BCA2|nr:NAD(P)-dependent alcohol dehydrogenase [Erwinia sp. 198]RRZ94637.1 NAD(P)-dependent alcohol dehydrogenase [Erwinia sp. 198]